MQVSGRHSDRLHDGQVCGRSLVAARAQQPTLDGEHVIIPYYWNISVMGSKKFSFCTAQSLAGGTPLPPEQVPDLPKPLFSQNKGASAARCVLDDHIQVTCPNPLPSCKHSTHLMQIV